MMPSIFDFRVLFVGLGAFLVLYFCCREIYRRSFPVFRIFVIGSFLRLFASGLFCLGVLPRSDSELYALVASNPSLYPKLGYGPNYVFILKLNQFIFDIPGGSYPYYSMAVLGALAGIVSATLVFLGTFQLVDSVRGRRRLALILFCFPGFIIWHSDNLKEPYIALGLAITVIGLRQKNIFIQLLGLLLAAMVRPDLGFIPLVAFVVTKLLLRIRMELRWDRLQMRLLLLVLTGYIVVVKSGVYRTLKDRPLDLGSSDLASAWTGSIPYPGMVRVFTGIEPWARPVSVAMGVQTAFGLILAILLGSSLYGRYRERRQCTEAELWCLLVGIGGSAVVVLSSVNAGLIDRIRSSYLLLLVPLMVGRSRRRSKKLAAETYGTMRAGQPQVLAGSRIRRESV
jgi:hypothetical protein